MKWLLVAIALFPFVVISFFDEIPQKTRKELEIRRRFMSNANSTTIYQKNTYFKRAILTSTDGQPDDLRQVNLGEIALEMNKIETEYNLPYAWGGSIRNHIQGLDCSGFIHGLLYFTGESNYRRRFNTRAFYNQLRRDRNYIETFNALNSSDYSLQDVVKNLSVGDIIMWPSGIQDGKNLPGQIWGHVGIVSTIIDGAPYVTHYVKSDAYNELDIYSRKGHGLNTLKAYTFINIKQRGVLSVFRQKGKLNET